MKNLIKSLALVGVLTVVGAARTQRKVVNGTFTAERRVVHGRNGMLAGPTRRNPELGQLLRYGGSRYTDTSGSMAVDG